MLDDRTGKQWKRSCRTKARNAGGLLSLVERKFVQVACSPDRI